MAFLLTFTVPRDCSIVKRRVWYPHTMALEGHVNLWVHGKPVGTPDPEIGVGTPICMGCENPIDTGYVFKGNGAVCRSCLDVARNELWEAMGRAISRSPTR